MNRSPTLPKDSSSTSEPSPPPDAWKNSPDATKRGDLRLYCRRVFVYLLSFTAILHLIWGYETPYAFVLNAFAFSLPGTLLAVLPALLPARASRPYLVISYVFLAVPAFICATHLVLFQTPVTAQSFFALFNAGSIPTGGFLQEHFAWHLCLLAAVITIIPAWLLHRALKIPQPAFGKAQAGLLIGLGSIVLALAMLLGPVKLLRSNILYNVYTSFAEFGSYMTRLQAGLWLNAGIHFTDARLITPPEEERTIVIVIGDAANRAHHSLYGYGRNTTPNLIIISDKLAVFKDVIATGTDPAACLREILALPGPEGQTLPVMTLLNQAGFHTYWLSNQPDIEGPDTETARLAAPAQNDAHLNRGGDPRFYPGLDEQLLAPLEQVLRDDPGRKVIFLRLMGSRPEYALRYPADFTRFANCSDIQTGPDFTRGDCASLNDYDNSIAYTDALLKDIIDLTARLAPESALVYLAAHGANAYGPPCQDSDNTGLKSIHYYQIPFFLWLSEGFQAANPDNAARWMQNTAHRATLSDFPYTLADLAGISFNGYDAARSLLSGQFLARPRLIDDRDYDAVFPAVNNRLPGDAHEP